MESRKIENIWEVPAGSQALIRGLAGFFALYSEYYDEDGNKRVQGIGCREEEEITKAA